jgi:hypothetical protein
MNPVSAKEEEPNVNGFDQSNILWYKFAGGMSTQGQYSHIS